ncbi:armadillo-type protein, partial [Piptocephalis cylindrospora]
SSLEEYVEEVKSGKLDWTPVHRSDAFWKNDSARFNDNAHELLKALCGILQTSTQATVLAVAAHDVGEYVKWNPLGKKYVEQFGAKQRIMELMGHEEPEVRYEALIAVQKYMVNAWD